MTALLASELFRLRCRPMARIMLLAMVGVLLGVYVVQAAPDPTSSSSTLNNLRPANAPAAGLDMVFQVGLVTSVVLAASSIATEYAWATIRVVLSRVDHRSLFLTAKLVSLLLFAALMILAGTVAAYGASYVVALWRDLDSDWGPEAASRMVLAPVRVFVATLPYLTLAFLVALWTRTTAAGFGVVVAAFYLDVLLGPLFEAGGALPWVPEDAFIWQNVSALLEANELAPSGDFPAVWTATAVLLAYAGAFGALAYLRLATRDVLGSS